MKPTGVIAEIKGACPGKMILLRVDMDALSVQQIAAQAFGEEAIDNCPPTMGAEDFGYYMTQIPGAFATVGSASDDDATQWPHHSGNFNVDENALKVGAELYAQYALAYLGQNEF